MPFHILVIEITLETLKVGVFFLSVHIPMIFVHRSCCLYKSQATCITPKLAGSLSAVLDSGESHDIYHGYRET